MHDLIFVTETPQVMAVGEAIAWVFEYADVGLTDPTAAGDTLVYNQRGKDVSGVMLSGNALLAGTQITAKMFTPTIPQRYTLVQPATVDGNIVYLAVHIEVVKLGG